MQQIKAESKAIENNKIERKRTIVKKNNHKDKDIE
jgi:hypothetical protein